MTAPPSFDVVIPTIGRPCLGELLQALADQGVAAAGVRVFLVDDRVVDGTPRNGTDGSGSLAEVVPAAIAPIAVVIPSRGRGPAAARNAGWVASGAEWVVFLDDDVVPAGTWLNDLTADLGGLATDVGASQGRITVPLPPVPSDWERNVRGLERARWATADIAYRRAALAGVGGFDERFPRAYREDADLGLRVTGAGYRIVLGDRRVTHPVRPAGPWISLRLQKGNRDDALMRALHGPGWAARAGVPRGRRARHLATTAAGAAAAAGLLSRRRWLAAAGLGTWLAGTSELAWARIAPGPKTRREVATMLATSLVMPAVASYHWIAGNVAARRLAGRA
jgi:cellulose synthase/poly-beta-1,6-N-acetylglucosamine synthase-like glycosyltransferase